LEINGDRNNSTETSDRLPFYSQKTVTHHWLPWAFSGEWIGKLKSGRGMSNTVMEKAVTWIFSYIGY
jgi:hypothetical protein